MAIDWLMITVNQRKSANQKDKPKNKFYKLAASSTIYFTILIHFYHCIVALQCVAAHAPVSTGFLRVPNKPLGTREFKFASKIAFLRCLCVGNLCRS